MGEVPEGRWGQQNRQMLSHLPVSLPEITYSATLRLIAQGYAAASGSSYPSERSFFLAAVNEA